MLKRLSLHHAFVEEWESGGGRGGTHTPSVNNIDRVSRGAKKVHKNLLSARKHID